jgi:hypothetical protein
MTPELLTYLTGWRAKAKAWQEAQGRTFDLTIIEFCDAFSPRLIKKMDQALAEGWLYQWMGRDNDFALIVGWASKAAFQAGIMNAETVKIQTRDEHGRKFWNQKGDVCSPAHRAAIAAYRTGQTHTQDTKDAISRALTGKLDTEAAKARKRQAARERWARARGEQLGGAA